MALRSTIGPFFFALVEGEFTQVAVLLPCWLSDVLPVTPRQLHDLATAHLYAWWYYAVVMPAVQSYILTQLPRPADEVSALNVACLLASLLNIGTPETVVAPYLDAVVDRQEGDGSWPAWAAYLGIKGKFDGAPALSTAVALDALAKAARLPNATAQS